MSKARIPQRLRQTIAGMRRWSMPSPAELLAFHRDLRTMPGRDAPASPQRLAHIASKGNA